MSADTVWNMHTAYRMVRERDHALTDRQRALQYEQTELGREIVGLRKLIDTLADSIATVNRAGGDSANLSAQLAGAHESVARIKPRHEWLELATSHIAANLRLLNMAHDALHWLNFENERLGQFDSLPMVPKPTGRAVK